MRQNPERGRIRGWQIHGCTEDSGPEKPGNSVEEKTLTTRKEPELEGPQGQRTRRLSTVNTHLKRGSGNERSPSLDDPLASMGSWEAEDERRR